MGKTQTLSIVLDARGFAEAIRLQAYLLRVTRGPARRQQKRVAGRRITIGASPAAGFSIDDPTVSALHCEICTEEAGFRVVDLGAKNAVLLNGRRVRDAWLESGDELRLGASAVKIKMLEDAEAVTLGPIASLGGLKGSSLRMRELYQQINAIAAIDVTVLIEGETGTGKELAAEAIVSSGPRRDRPFELLDCAALSPSLAESELFGHEAGAFTGAQRQHKGPFERASGGTVFLDEVGELPLELQPKLLGVLERRSLRRVGGDEDIPVDVRILAATHRDLRRDVNRGAFRADLYYRLAGAFIRMPALREHREDIPELVAHFLDDVSSPRPLSPQVFRRLCDGDYPGNVRELRNAVERAVSLPAGVIPGTEARRTAGSAPADALALPFRTLKEQVVRQFEHEYLLSLIAEAGGNVSEAARRSGLSRLSLYELLRRHELKLH